MNDRRILITGSAGMVGSYASGAFKDYELVQTDCVPGFTNLDICDHSATMSAVAEIRPGIVLHLAAVTDVDRCEQEPDWAYQANAIGTQNVALACQAFNATLIYISTAGVFGGDKPEPYIEFDDPKPANVYGHSKLAGERIVTSLLQHYYIVRAGWMIGGGEKDKKFAGKILRLISGGCKKLQVVHDKVGSPTYAKDLLTGIEKLIKTNRYGLYHMVNEGCCSRYDVALLLKEILRSDVSIIPVTSAHFPLPAPRARSEAMRNLNLDLIGLFKMRSWQSALREYVVDELAPAFSIDIKK